VWRGNVRPRSEASHLDPPEAGPGGPVAVGVGTFALMLAVTVALYGRALDAPFVFDDRPAIVENPSLRRLWPPIGDAAARGPLNPPPLAPTARRPLANLTLAVDHHFHGLRPAGYRATNFVLHALAATLLALLVRATLRLPYFAGAWAGAAGPIGLAVALVWLVHPLVSEAVVYVTQRTELVAAVLYLATLWAALRHWTAATPRAAQAWGGAAVAACAGAMASKEIAASLPLAVWLYERTFLVDSWRATLRSWRLHAGLAAGWLVLLALNVGGASGLSDARHSVSPLVWWATQTKVTLLYLKLAVWPWPLAIHYTPAYLRTAADAAPWIVAFALAAGLTVAAVRRRPAARFVVLAAVMVLAPTAVVPLAKMMAAERRMYLPLAGLVVLAVVGGWRALAASGARRPSIAAAGAFLAIVVTFGAVTVRRLAVYESAVTLWTDTVRTQPDDAMARYNLGVALLEDGRPPAEAMARFEEALRLDPQHAGALDNLGLVLLRERRYDEARRRFEGAITVDPDNAVALNNLGALELDLGRPAAAVPVLERALAAEPDLPKGIVHRNLGKALVGVGRAADGLVHYDHAVRLDPADAEAQNGRGAALLALGRPGAARPAFERALRVAPDDPSIANNLATALLQTGRIEDAVVHLERVLARDPANRGARNNYGTALRTLGRTEEAIEQFRRVIAAEPAHATAHYNLGSALLDTGRPAEAVGYLEEALRLGLDDAQVRFKCAIAYVHAGRGADGVAMGGTAVALARTRGQTALATEIEGWLAAYRPSGS
jgi:Flp pilus assembly protein TadD